MSKESGHNPIQKARNLAVRNDTRGDKLTIRGGGEDLLQRLSGEQDGPCEVNTTQLGRSHPQTKAGCSKRRILGEKVLRKGDEPCQLGCIRG